MILYKFVIRILPYLGLAINFILLFRTTGFLHTFWTTIIYRRDEIHERESNFRMNRMYATKQRNTNHFNCEISATRALLKFHSMVTKKLTVVEISRWD